ncbi:hypothetical protein PDJAM_G00035320 [Pangasius djambal]|uniref:Uncharacterized protein n=1 Tax=Pangasius djambal TaxID=1691987 RepID=A0ACC5YRG6_9TELE|nr:hypothetical protein [Pangasius djambal]
MQCPECQCAVKAFFRFCPECGHRLSSQPSKTTGGKPPEQLVHQDKEGKQNQPDSDTDANSSSEHCTEIPGARVREKVISNPGLTSSLTDTNQDKDGYASERMPNEISTIKDVPQDGSSLSSEKATEENVRRSIDAASQNTQTSPHVQDRMAFQSHQMSSSDFPNTHVLPGNTRSEESECSIQSFPAPPGIRSSSSEASSQSNVRPDSVKCQLTEEHVEMEVNSSSSEPDSVNNLKTESPTDDFSPPRPDNELQSVQCALSDSAAQPQIQDQNEHKSPPSVNEATKVVLSSHTLSSTAGILPPSGDWNTKAPDTSSHGDLAKAQTEDLNQQSPVPLQPSISHATESTKEETHTLQCSTGQGEKQQNPLNRKLFGPYNNEEGTAAKPKADNVGNQQQTKHEDVKAQKKETNDLQKIRDKETPKQGFNTENPLPQEKNVPSDQNDEVGFQEVSSKKKKGNQNHPSNQQQDPKDITIFFHAILSKHFNIDPSRDSVTIRSGALAGNWSQDILKMEITRDLEHNGYLVHGKLQTSKKNVRNCIPYKYVVLKQGKSPEYEHIYKPAERVIVNRCLSIKENLLTQQGEWHQYDDIICTKPPHAPAVL